MSLRTKSFGSATLGARGFVVGGRSFVSLVIKAAGTVHPTSGEIALDAVGAPLVVEERTLRGSPLASLVHASDVALVVPMAEVLVIGSATAPRGTVVQRQLVRLSLHRAGSELFCKELLVTAPQPFAQLPLAYERAFGGMTSRVNPVGVGQPPDTTAPNIRYAREGAPTELPVGLGPIPGVWPLRQRKRATLSQHDATGGPWLTLPDGFDETFFQAAPSDQWLPDLLPGDVLGCSGMHADAVNLRVIVPRLRAVTLTQHPGGARTARDLRLDTLFLDTETLRVELLYRGAFPLDRAEAEASLFLGALDTPERPFAFPEGAQLDEERVEVAPRAAPSHKTFRGTQILEPDAPAAAPPPAAAPRGTMELPAPKPSPVHSSTVVLELEDTPASLPFERRGAPETPRRPAEAPPGSPWDPRANERRVPTASLHSTMVLAPESVPADVEAALSAPRPPPPPAPPPPTKADSEPPPAKRASVWREDPPPPPEAAKPAPPPPAVPKADLSKHLYKKMKR